VRGTKGVNGERGSLGTTYPQLHSAGEHWKTVDREWGDAAGRRDQESGKWSRA